MMMNFKQLQDRVLTLNLNEDTKDSLARAVRELDGIIDDLRDTYNDLESALSNFDNDDLDNLQRELDVMPEPEAVEVKDPIAEAAYTWRIAGALLLANADEIAIIKQDNPEVFWAALSLALANYPPYRTVQLNLWILRTFPV
jgi:hypothetical protein